MRQRLPRNSDFVGRFGRLLGLKGRPETENTKQVRGGLLIYGISYGCGIIECRNLSAIIIAGVGL